MKEIIGIQDATWSSDGVTHVATRIFYTDNSSPGLLAGVSAHEAYIADHLPSEFSLGPVTAILYEPTRSGKARCVGVI